MLEVTFKELRGELRPGPTASAGAVPPSPSVVLSNIIHGTGVGPKRQGLTMSYVARGTEDYRIAGRHYRINGEQFMLTPQSLGSEVEIRRDERQGTLGMCIFLPGTSEMAALLDGPIVLPARCGMGVMLGEALRSLNQPMRRPDQPALIAHRAGLFLSQTLLALDAQVDAVSGLKRRTRFEAARRMNIARAYLHKIVDRPVSLEELGREVAVSPFQLLRSFRACFGETPAVYHRRLRLNLAREAVESAGHSYEFVSDRFGFAGGSSLSHAYKRTFGVPPVRALERCANALPRVQA